LPSVKNPRALSPEESKELLMKLCSKISYAIDDNFTEAIKKVIPKPVHNQTTALTIDVDDYRTVSVYILFVIPKIACAQMIRNSSSISAHGWEQYLSKILHCAMAKPTNLVIPKLHFSTATFLAALTTKEFILKVICDLFIEIAVLRKHAAAKLETAADYSTIIIKNIGYYFPCRVWINEQFDISKFLLEDT